MKFNKISLSYFRPLARYSQIMKSSYQKSCFQKIQKFFNFNFYLCSEPNLLRKKTNSFHFR